MQSVIKIAIACVCPSVRKCVYVCAWNNGNVRVRFTIWNFFFLLPLSLHLITKQTRIEFSTKYCLGLSIQNICWAIPIENKIAAALRKKKTFITPLEKKFIWIMFWKRKEIQKKNVCQIRAFVSLLFGCIAKKKRIVSKKKCSWRDVGNRSASFYVVVNICVK